MIIFIERVIFKTIDELKRDVPVTIGIVPFLPFKVTNLIRYEKS